MHLSCVKVNACLHVYVHMSRYMVTLGAPISIAQRMGEDTLTYLNRGTYVHVYFMPLFSVYTCHMETYMCVCVYAIRVFVFFCIYYRSAVYKCDVLQRNEF